MTNRYRTPRDTALELGRRMQLGRRLQLGRQQFASPSTGHPLEIARAVRSLAMLRGGDATGREPVVWNPAGWPTSPGQIQRSALETLGSLVPQAGIIAERPGSPIPRSARPRRPAWQQPLGAPTSPPGADVTASWPVQSDAPDGSIAALDELAAASLPNPAGSWRVADSWPGEPPAGAFDVSPADAVAVTSSAQNGAASSAAAASAASSPPPTGSGSGRTGTFASRQASNPLQVKVEAIPRRLEEQLQKIHGQARRELQDFRLMCAAQGRTLRR